MADNQNEEVARISPEGVRTFIDELRTADSEMAEIRGEVKGIWDDFEEAGGNKHAGRVLKKMRGMSEGQRQDFKRGLDELKKMRGMSEGQRQDFKRGLDEGYAALFEDDTADMFAVAAE